MNIAVVGSKGFVGRNLMERLMDHKVFEFNRGDYLDFEYVHTVIHLACDPDSRHSNEKFPKSVDDNIGIFTQSLAEAVERNVKRFIYISSTEAPKEDTIYAIGKMTCEKILKVVAEEHGMEYVIIRPANLYGKYMDMNDTGRNVVANFMRCIRDGKELPIQDNGRAYPFTHVNVLVDFILCSLTEFTNENYEVSSHLYIPITQLAELLEGITKTWDWVKKS
jgi:nucleoside-diphosphate-sugar epimerase